MAKNPSIILPGLLTSRRMHRNLQCIFIERGLAAAAEARHSGEYFSTDEVLTELDQIIDAQRNR